MKKVLSFIITAAIFVLLLEIPLEIKAAKGPNATVEEAIEALQKMMEEKDAHNMGRLLRKAEGVAIFPSVVKAGFVFGGRYGHGLLLKRDKEADNWFGPHFVTISGASWGLQAGIQSTALVMVIMNERGMKGFTGDKITLGGDLGVAAGPVGRQTGVGTDGSFSAEIYAYSMSKGIFAGLSLEGSIISSNNEGNEDFWGDNISIESILKRKSEEKKVEFLVKSLNSLIMKTKTNSL